MRTTNPLYPRTTHSEACVITDAGDIVAWFDSTRDAAIYASGYAGRFAMFVTTNERTADGRMLVTFDCSF